MISRTALASKPPVYNKPKTEMQKKFTIDVKTKILRVRKDYDSQNLNNNELLDCKSSSMTELTTKYLTS